MRKGEEAILLILLLLLHKREREEGEMVKVDRWMDEWMSTNPSWCKPFDGNARAALLV